MWTREVVALLFRDIRAIALAFLIPVALALVLAFLAPKRYEAEAKVLVSVNDAQTRVFADSTGPQVTAVEVINSEVEVLTSKDLARRTLESVGGDGALAAGSRPAVGEKAITEFFRDLTVKAVPASHVILLRYKARTQPIAANVLNTYLRLYRSSRDQAGAGPAGELIRHELAALEADAADADQQIAKIKADAGLFDPDQEKKNLLDSRSAVSATIAQLQAHAAELRSKAAALDAAQRTIPRTIAQFPTADESDATAKARAQLLDLRQQQVKMSANYQPDSRAMRDLQSQIDGVEAFLTAETMRFSNKTKPGRNPLYDQMTAEAAQDRAQIGPDESHAALLQGQVTVIDKRLQAVAEAESRLAPLLRRKTSDGAALEALRQKQAAALVGAAGSATGQSVSVIEAPEARADAKPAEPKKVLFVLGGIIAGLGLSGALLAAAFARKNTFLVPETVENVTGVPVLVSLPVRPG